MVVDMNFLELTTTHMLITKVVLYFEKITKRLEYEEESLETSLSPRALPAADNASPNLYFTRS